MICAHYFTTLLDFCGRRESIKNVFLDRYIIMIILYFMRFYIEFRYRLQDAYNAKCRQVGRTSVSVVLLQYIGRGNHNYLWTTVHNHGISLKYRPHNRGWHSPGSRGELVIYFRRRLFAIISPRRTHARIPSLVTVIIVIVVVVIIIIIYWVQCTTCKRNSLNLSVWPSSFAPLLKRLVVRKRARHGVAAVDGRDRLVDGRAVRGPPNQNVSGQRPRPRRNTCAPARAFTVCARRGGRNDRPAPPPILSASPRAPPCIGMRARRAVRHSTTGPVARRAGPTDDRPTTDRPTGLSLVHSRIAAMPPRCSQCGRTGQGGWTKCAPPQPPPPRRHYNHRVRHRSSYIMIL